MNDHLFVPGSQGPVSATIDVPSSKSQANRALICAFLARGDSFVSGLPAGDDVEAMVSVLEAAAALDRSATGEARIRGGSADRLPPVIWSNLAGTTSRFLTAVGTLSSHEVLVDGAEPLRRRPMGELHEALRTIGANVECRDQFGHLPVAVGGRAIEGGEVRLRADVSSQFVSALMLIGPVLPRGIVIRLEGEVVSAPYIAMTARVMEDFGAVVEVSSRHVTVGQGGYTGRRYDIEPDFSSAAFPIMATVIAGGTLRVRRLARATSQGDSRILEFAERMGADVLTVDEDVVVRRDGETELRPLNANLADCSDLVPVVATACLFSRGSSSLTGIGFIREKESNRLDDLAHELVRLGGSVRAVEDGLEIAGGRPLVPTALATHDDHRLAMAFACAANGVPGLAIENPGVVSKSWPHYFEDMAPIIGVSSSSTLGFDR